MPRCDTCLAQLASAEVRKLPGRDAHRCKDKFQCLLRVTNSQPYIVMLEVTIPAKSLAEARKHADYIASQSKEIPMRIVAVTDADGNEVDANDIRQAIRRNATTS